MIFVIKAEVVRNLFDCYVWKFVKVPQPILSVKLHKNTPEKFYKEMGEFMFSPGVLTPSFFNDDSLFELLEKHGVDKADLPDISIAGCQEPLVMGKDNGNTTNSWLNLAKILELTLTGGISTVTGEKLSDTPKADLGNLKEEFFKNTEIFAKRIAEAANGASKALSNLRVPFLSCFMGGLENGIDLRDTHKQGTKYNGSGCLIHGASVVADSLVAVERLLKERSEDKDRLIDAIKNNFEGYDELREYLSNCPKFGNNDEADKVIVEIINRVSDIVEDCKNYLGNSFRPDFSSPSTHLLYGYWVGATPEILRRVLAEPEKYDPSGVYIMRIHGTFVNFLDLSPAI